MLLAGLLAATTAAGQKQEDGSYLGSDLALLPEVCMYATGFPGAVNRDKRKAWEDRLGRDATGGNSMLNHMHHYCRGLIWTNRAVYTAKNTKERQQVLNSSIGEFSYVIRNSPPGFVLLPEFLTKRGENLVKISRGPEGDADLNRAIAIKGDYWPPYAALSDYYKSMGELGKARDVIEKGLAMNPGTKALERRAAELGGTKRSADSPAAPVRTTARSNNTTASVDRKEAPGDTVVK